MTLMDPYEPGDRTDMLEEWAERLGAEHLAVTTMDTFQTLLVIIAMTSSLSQAQLRHILQGDPEVIALKPGGASGTDRDALTTEAAARVREALAGGQ